MVTDRIPRRHQRIHRSVPTEDTHLDRLLELASDLLLFQSLLLQRPVTIGLVHGTHQHRIDLTRRHILREGSIAAPLFLLEEGWLQLLTHMIAHRLLGILLHPRINGGIDLQTIGIEVIKLAIRPFVLVAPAEHRVGFPSQRVFTEFLSLPRGIITAFRFFGRQGQTQILPEIGSQAILMIQTGKTDGKRQGFQRVTFALAQVTRLDHLLQDRIPTASCTFVLAYRIEIGRILAHTDQGCRLLDFQGFRGTAKIDTGCRLNTHRIVEEIELVQIHVDDLLLRIVAF